MINNWPNAINLLSLRFSDEVLEKKFSSHFFSSSLNHGRLCHYLAILFYSADGIRDFILFPEYLPQLLFIRYGLIVPMFIAGLAFSYLREQTYQNIWQPLFAFYFFMTGTGAVIIMMIPPPTLGQSLYIGLIYCLVFGYTFIRLRFIFAAAVGLLLTAGHLLTTVWGMKLAAELLWIQIPFVIGINVLGMFVAYTIEHNIRKNFFLQELLRRQKKAIDAVNADLEKRVQQRTRELQMVNNDLIKQMESLRQNRMEKMKLEFQLRQAHKMEAIGTLAGGIAHDFNNILSSVIGFTELAMDDTGPESPVWENLQEVYTAGIRAKELVKQILTFARQTEEEAKPIQVNPIVKEIIKLLRSSIPTSIEIRHRLESKFFTFSDPTNIHQIVMNLATNASHAMEDGGILDIRTEDIHISNVLPDTGEVIKPGEYVKLTVSDTGTGIEKEILESIFEPYFTTKEYGEGTGMGLAMVYGIVKKYEGEITVTSKIGRGSTFTIYLPATPENDRAETYQAEILPDGTENILYVDDEPSIAKISERILQKQGYRVTTRTSSIEALELFRSRPLDFDLVITDMTMPNLTGEKLARELMEVRPDIPVILCTGYSKKISDDTVAQVGLKALVYKPIVKSSLLKTVRNVLDDMKNPAPTES